MNLWSLRKKITLLVGIVTFLACLILTANSIYSADSFYGHFLNNGSGKEEVLQSVEGAIEDEEYEIESEETNYMMISHKFSMQSMGMMLIIVVCSLIATYWITGRILDPLVKLTRKIQSISEKNLHERVKISETTQEVYRLTCSFNGMMDRLEESFAIQKQFAANAAHELKTPLTVMKTSLQVLEMVKEPTKQDYQEFMEDMREALDRIIKTVDSLLNLAGNIETEKTEEILLYDLLQQIIDDLKIKAWEKEVSLTVFGDNIAVMGNPMLMYRLFYNLIENAIKYNKPYGSVEATVCRTEKGSLVKISDTGIGIKPEMIDHIFEPFYRGDHSRSQEIPGSGLGLAIVHLLAERLGGSLRVESKPNEGTAVSFFFKSKN